MKAIEVRLAARDLRWSDAAPDNLGRDNERNLKIIDGGISSTRPGREPPAPAKVPSLTEAAMSLQRVPGAQSLQAERQDFDGAVYEEDLLTEASNFNDERMQDAAGNYVLRLGEALAGMLVAA